MCRRRRAGGLARLRADLPRTAVRRSGARGGGGRSAREAIALAETTGLRAGLRYARSALGFLWLSMDRVMDAIDELEAVEHLISGTGVGDVTGAPWAPDLVESYLRTDRHRDAGRVLEILAHHAGRPGARAGLLRAAEGCSRVISTPTFASLWHATTPPAPRRSSARAPTCTYGRRLRRAGRRADTRGC